MDDDDAAHVRSRLRIGVRHPLARPGAGDETRLAARVLDLLSPSHRGFGQVEHQGVLAVLLPDKAGTSRVPLDSDPVALRPLLVVLGRRAGAGARLGYGLCQPSHAGTTQPNDDLRVAVDLERYLSDLRQ